MSAEPRRYHVPLAIIGSGLAGFAAAIFALERNIPSALVGHTGAVAYTTGYFDLLGQLRDGTAVDSPWQALAELRQQEPEHPLSRMSSEEIRSALTGFTAFLGEQGIAYTPPADHNLIAMTPAGTVKRTLSLPITMAAGPSAMAAGRPCRVIDFHGLKGFSGRQVAVGLHGHWPHLEATRLAFPGIGHGELYPEAMARSLEVPGNRERFAELLQKAAGKVGVIGLPAILGMYRPDLVRAEMERLTGLEIFEIPTMPPAVPGIRLREMFHRVLPERGVTLIAQQKVTSLSFSDDGARLESTDNLGPLVIEARAVVLATGRFLSGGLEARRQGGIREPLLDLPVVQPPQRSQWYQEIYTDPRGHAINRAGIVVDDSFRPLDRHGRVFDPRLFAAGVILAHQDWIRSRSGAGIAIASAHRAVAEAARLLAGGA